jgi:hypothetical protein
MRQFFYEYIVLKLLVVMDCEWKVAAPHPPGSVIVEAIQATCTRLEVGWVNHGSYLCALPPGSAWNRLQVPYPSPLVCWCVAWYLRGFSLHNVTVLI